MNKVVNGISSFFQFKERNTTFKKEIIGGLSTFMAMAYILAVNPGMLSQSNGGDGYAGVFFLGTVISSFLGTMLMGIFANVPVALAPGMGVNAFFTYTVAGSILGLQVEQALICTFFSGIIYVFIAISPARKYIARLLPRNVKLAIGAMIGFFLAYIGLQDAGIIQSDAWIAPWDGSLQTATSTKMGDLSDPFVIIAMVTLLLVFVLHFMKVPAAALIAMIASVIMIAIAYGAGVDDAGNAFKIGNYESFNKFGELSSGMWKSMGSTLANPKSYIAIFVFLYIDFFDTTGTLFAVGEQAKLNSGPDKGEKWMGRANMVDAASTIMGSILLTSTTTSYIESSVGVSQGAKTGFASVITGSLFAISIAAWPILTPIMPIAHETAGAHATIMPATGPILVLVGALMISQLKHFDWKTTVDIPTLFTILMFGTLSYSISTGIAAGMIMYFLLNSSAWAMHTFKAKRGKSFSVNDEEIVDTEINHHIKTHEPNYRERILNPVVIIMFLLAVTYFATMPLYM